MKRFFWLGLPVAVLMTDQVIAQEVSAPAAVNAQDVLNILIQQGVVDERKLQEVVRKAQEKTREQYQSGVETVPSSRVDTVEPDAGAVVRVPYIPQYIKDDIRDKVRTELRDDVVADVMKKAEEERWGLPGTAPDWTQRIKFSGDIRLRAESIMFASENNPLQYENFNAINKAGGVNAAGLDAYYNTTEDRARLRTRLRFGLKAKVTAGVDAGVRLATGSTGNPVSTNETLGDYGKSFDLQMDRAYLSYHTFAEDVVLVGGRFENPFLRTDLVWDNDLQFDGVAASYYWLRSTSWEDDDRQWDPFITIGVFPVDEFELSGDDKWLFGTQIGFVYHTWEQDSVKFGIGYYHYENMAGIQNEPDRDTYDYTAPDSFQKGNATFNIRNNPATPQDELYALAFDYHIVDVLLEYDIASFSPHHVILTAEYIENIGADEDEALARAFPDGNIDDVARRNAAYGKDGFLVKATFGWPIVAKPGDWQVAVSYRELGADAVVDAFADSDFHLGGTDGRGYILEVNYGLLNEVWMTAKWLSSNEIDDDPLGVDILQLDINARF